MKTLFVRNLGETHAILVCKQWTVHDLKTAVFQASKINPRDQVLSYGGGILTDDALRDIDENSTLDLNRRLLGGKIHGSLAKVGKVKSNTPPVEPEEKKKKKTGRAKCRMLYNRRFAVKAVDIPGRKRGPNANR